MIKHKDFADSIDLATTSDNYSVHRPMLGIYEICENLAKKL